MKQKFLKIAAVFAAVMAVVAYLPVTVPVAETAMTVWADDELPFVPIGNNSYKFTNNTDYVTAMWNGQNATTGLHLKTAIR